MKLDLVEPMNTGLMLVRIQYMGKGGKLVCKSKLYSISYLYSH